MVSLRTRNGRRAVTLTELLVVLAIISLLATLAVPVYVSQTERARRAVAQFEVRQIADSQQAVAATYGFYVPIHILDNIPDDVEDTNARDDFENDPNLNEKRVIDIAIPVTSQELDADQLRLDAATVDPRVKSMIDNWSGPFLNPQRVTADVNQNSIITQEEISRDIVLDPWGRPYRFYTPYGPTGNTDFEDELEDWDPTDDDVTTGYFSVDNLRITIYDDASDPVTIPYRNRFDRFAIVSFGGDGASDTSNEARAIDDIYYTFGTSLPQAPTP
jgi:prepilin-type N-terminal cleavage/methylation domain-containing protein